MAFEGPSQPKPFCNLTSRSYLAIMALERAHFPLFWCLRLIRSWGEEEERSIRKSTLTSGDFPRGGGEVQKQHLHPELLQLLQPCQGGLRVRLMQQLKLL